MKPLISVIVPCYNVAEYLPICLASLERQTIGIENLEIILVDDASTDRGSTWGKILEFERKYPDNCMAICLEENRCQGGARNAGLMYARGEYIGFVDSDDWIDKEMYQILYNYAVQYNCDVVDCRMKWEFSVGSGLIEEKDNRFDEVRRCVMDGGSHWIDFFPRGGYESGIVTKIYKAELILKNQIYFPEKIKYEDNYWSDILMLYVKNFYHVGGCFYHYRQNEESTIHKRNQKYHLDRLKIEVQKVEKYKELGLMERFPKEIEWDFLKMYFCNTLYILWSRFEEPPYDVYLEMVERVKTLFPDYKKNPYLTEGDIHTILVNFIEKDLNKRQFLEAGKIIMEFIETGTV